MSNPGETGEDDAPITTSKTARSERDLFARSVTINRPSREVYDFFRDFENLPTFMENIERIEVKDARLSHWVVKAPMGQTVEWDAEVTEDVPGEALYWQSRDGDVPNSGRVTFEERSGGRGTVVTATFAWEPPLGTVGKLAAKLFQREPHIQARRDLRRLKQLLETGEIATGARNRRLIAEGKN